MKKNIALVYKILIYLALVILIVGSISVLVDPNSNLTGFISIQEAKIGTILLFVFLLMKSLYLLLKKRKNSLINFLRVNNTFQKEQGILVFILFAGHFIVELIKYFGTNVFISVIISIIIPILILIYMAVTSIRSVQKKHKKWKRNHSIIWLTIPLILVHVLLVSEIRLTYVVLACLLIVVVVFELFFISERGKKHALFILIGSALSLITFGALNAKLNPITDTPTATNNPSPSTIEPDNNQSSNDTTYVDGTYQGTARGFEGPITVEVVVTNQLITSVEVVSENESRPLNSYEVIPPKIIENNGTDNVNTIAGSTTTSDAVISATEDALSKAQ